MLFTQSHKLGWLPSPSDHRDVDTRSLGLVGSAEPLSVSVTEWMPPVYDQGRSQSCVGQGIAAQLDAVHRQAFGRHGCPAPLAIYTAARELHTTNGAPLRDDGTYPRLALRALRSVGVPDEADWPMLRGNVNKRLPFRVAVQANGRRGAKYAYVMGERIAGIRAALAAGYPVGFGALVAKSYMRNEGPYMVTLPPKSDPIVGGHYQVIVGVTPNNNFRVRNSWGTKWRDGGHCWMTPDYITSALCSEFNIVYGWEAVRNARFDF